MAGLLHIVDAARESVRWLLGTIGALVAAVAAAVPAVRLVYASGREGSTSRGDAIFAEAKTVKDHLGSVSCLDAT